MVLKIRAHFDGKVIVPDEPVALPVDQPLVAELTLTGATEPGTTAAERQAAFDRLMSRSLTGLNIADGALRRENL